MLGRVILEPAEEGRLRLDAGTWGTMGVGLGYCVAAAAAASGQRLVVAVEGDSAFGFSGMEVETLVRWVAVLLGRWAAEAEAGPQPRCAGLCCVGWWGGCRRQQALTLHKGSQRPVRLQGGSSS